MGKSPPQLFHCLITSPDGSSLLVHNTTQVRTLPNLREPDKFVNHQFGERLTWTYHTDKLVAELFSAYGIRIYPRRIVWEQPETSAEQPETSAEQPETSAEQPETSGSDHHIIIAADLVSDASPLPNGLEWITKSEAVEATWAHVHSELDMIAVMNELFGEVFDGTVPVNRPVWRRSGWCREISAWALSVLRSNTLEPMEDYLEPLRNIPCAVVFRCRLKKIPYNPERAAPPELAFVKCSLPSSREAAKTATVASLFPQVVPRVLAVHDKFNAMVQVEAWTPREDDYVVLDCLWRFQHESLQVIDKLKAGGVPDRGPIWLVSVIDGILNHPVLHSKSEKLLKLGGRASEIKEICRTIAGFKIPLTLVHGDYVEENFGIMSLPKRESTPAVFDWYTCCIGNPLYDVVRASLQYMMVDEEAIDSYLDQWESVESRENIRTIRALLKPLVLSQNVFDLEDMYDNMEPCDQGEWRDPIRNQAEAILDSLNGLDRGVRDTEEQ